MTAERHWDNPRWDDDSVRPTLREVSGPEDNVSVEDLMFDTENPGPGHTWIVAELIIAWQDELQIAKAPW